MWGLVSTKRLRHIWISPITRPVVRVTSGFLCPEALGMVLLVVGATERQSLDLLSLWIKDALLPVSRFSAQAATKKGVGPSAIPPQKNARRIKAPLPQINPGSGES